MKKLNSTHSRKKINSKIMSKPEKLSTDKLWKKDKATVIKNILVLIAVTNQMSQMMNHSCLNLQKPHYL